MPTNSLTTVVNEPKLPAVELTDLTADLEQLVSFCHEIGLTRDWTELYDEGKLAAWRKTAATVPALQARWEAVDRLASSEFIATQSLQAIIAFTNSSGGADSDLFARLIADDIAARKPHCFALATAMSEVRAKFRFLSISDVLTELNAAEKTSRRYRNLFNKTLPKLTEHLKKLEADLPEVTRWRQEAERRRQEEKREEELQNGHGWRWNQSMRKERRMEKIRRSLWLRLDAEGRVREYGQYMDKRPEGWWTARWLGKHWGIEEESPKRRPIITMGGRISDSGEGLEDLDLDIDGDDEE